MPDDADRADLAIQQHLDAAIAAARGILPPETESAGNCQECGLEIPSARMNAVSGCQYCIDCATKLEGRKLRGLV